MGSISLLEKPHAVCIPFPAQGHINPMLKLAKLLHSRGFHITFVNTEFNHKRLLKARGPNSLDGLPSFQFETIPDGLPPTDVDATQDIPALCYSTPRHSLVPFKNLLAKLNSSPVVPPVTCVVSDGVMSFTLDAAEELGIPEVLFWTTSACGFMGYVHYKGLIERGLTPLKDESYLTNGYLNTPLDWIPGMKNIRLRDIPTFIRTTDPNDNMIKFILTEIERVQKASAVILNTFYDLEHDVLDSLKTILAPPVYSIGSLSLLANQIPSTIPNSVGSNLWKEDLTCLDWLDSKEPNSVVYVNFGSITVMTPAQLIEFAWGLANSNKTFLWVIRPDLVAGETAVLTPEFATATENRSLLTSWCPQEQVLNHKAVGGFLTHSGWNSTLESICGGVPMLCWPFFAEQQTNCRYSCEEWGIGMEIESDAKRDEIQRLVIELMDGEKGEAMKKKAQWWRNMAFEATSAGSGSSFANFEKVVQHLLQTQALTD
ncbi:7-deoxyloganetin glucosyltransferase-like [Humulus lupulus]|uniref:7-deoxyloganetin glucosyltransferase-like n=1 Tax=Humulus lupulus TaxID=3486 RepID=UPI002B413AD7|nr:7-deoxyloganetin glucosyltransferase-like [Humulus lupulus]